MPNATRPLILASTSAYRNSLLSRLGLPFTTAAPGIDETAQAGESPAQLATRLALGKARSVQARNPGALVIGSDQVAERAGTLIGKPGSLAANREQLLASSEAELRFSTAVALVGDDGADSRLDVTTVRFRALDAGSVQRYLDREPAPDCAGGFKAEGLGISLFDEIDSRDPTALVGLPLIALCALLREAGVDLP